MILSEVSVISFPMITTVRVDEILVDVWEITIVNPDEKGECYCKTNKFVVAF